MKSGPTWTEEHRKQCEIRWVLTLSKPQRAAFYADVARHRGKEAAQLLMAEVSAEWGRRNRGRY
ncbi:DUF7696 family protein [Zoogloea dura]